MAEDSSHQCMCQPHILTNSSCPLKGFPIHHSREVRLLMVLFSFSVLLLPHRIHDVPLKQIPSFLMNLL